MKLSLNMQKILTRFDLASAVELAKNAGFTAMDYPLFDMKGTDSVFVSPDYRAAAEEIRAVADGAQFPVNQTHAPFTFPAEQFDDPNLFREYVMPRIIRSLEISGILGASVCVVHPIHHMEYRGHEEEIFLLNMDYYRSLIPYAKEYGVKIGVENMFRRDPLRKYVVADTCSTPEEFVRYIDTLDSDAITACLDIGHVSLPLSDFDASDMIRALGHDRLGALHVHDNDYTGDQHALPYLGKLDWAKITRALGEIDYSGDFTFEVDGRLFLGCDEGFVPIGMNFMGAVGSHLVSMIEANRPRR